MPIHRSSSPLAALLVALLVGLAACGPSTGDSVAGSEVSTATDTSTSSPTSELSASTSTSTSTPTSTGASSSAAETTATGATTSETTATTATTSAPTTTATTTTSQSTTTEANPEPTPIPIRIQLDRRVGDAATEGFESFVQAVLTDERGWSQAGFEFTFAQAGGGADYTVVLAEGSEVDSLCLPYDTFGRFSCQIGPVVALNADRWRSAVDSWPVSLDEYRTMLVNHEVGHLLGQHHPSSRCPGDGQPAPVMAQQSSGVAPCTANPWPLAWEITCAKQGVEPLAPPYERNITLTCGPDGPRG